MTTAAPRGSRAGGGGASGGRRGRVSAGEGAPMRCCSACARFRCLHLCAPVGVLNGQRAGKGLQVPRLQRPGVHHQSERAERRSGGHHQSRLPPLAFDRDSLLLVKLISGLEAVAAGKNAERDLLSSPSRGCRPPACRARPAARPAKTPGAIGWPLAGAQWRGGSGGGSPPLPPACPCGRRRRQQQQPQQQQCGHRLAG